jgi:hypothetical protein
MTNGARLDLLYTRNEGYEKRRHTRHAHYSWLRLSRFHYDSVRKLVVVFQLRRQHNIVDA